MSWTPSVGVVGANYWSYMAAVLAEALDHAVKERRVDPALVPRGVYRDAEEFFRRALNAHESGHEARTPARMDAYAIAVDAVWDSAKSASTSEEIQQLLGRYSSFLPRLLAGGSLSSSELKLASKLREFFRSLSQAGDAEAYMDLDDFEPARIELVR